MEVVIEVEEEVCGVAWGNLLSHPAVRRGAKLQVHGADHLQTHDKVLLCTV